VAESCSQRIKRLKHASSARDRRMREVTMVRKGEVHLMAPGLFSEDWPKPLIANTVDTIARDFAGTLAPLPSLNCASRAMRTDKDKRAAEKKNKIGANYWRISSLASAMLIGADHYLSYGFMVGYVEPDFDKQQPMIRIEDSIGAYYERDRFGNVTFYVKTWQEPAWRVAERFPELAHMIIPKTSYGKPDPEAMLEVARSCDESEWRLSIVDGVTLSSYKHGLKRPPVVVAQRPGIDGNEAHGQFDQVLWTWLARARLALMQLDAANKAVNSPIVLPNDAVEFNVGPDAVIQTDNPSAVRKVSLELPSSAFAVADQLDNDVRIGSRFPEVRNGTPQASVITGRGVQALMSGYDVQIAEAQVVIGQAISRLTSLAFEIDVALWPNTRKRIMGNSAGEPFDLTYTPATDISDNFSCDVSYGYAAGLSPNQAIVMLLQLRGDKLISRDTFRRQLPFDVDVDDEQRRIDVNETEDAAMQGLFALLQSLGPMASAGVDPMPVLRASSEFIKARRNGVPVEIAMEKAFTKPTVNEEQGETAPDAETGPGEGGGPGGELPQGVNANGLPTGVAPGQAGMSPGGMPDISTLVAGLRGGRPVLDGSVTRRLPI